MAVEVQDGKLSMISLLVVRNAFRYCHNYIPTSEITAVILDKDRQTEMSPVGYG